MKIEDKAHLFHSLHVAGAPLILYNAWDAGSARTIAEAGSKAIATGSWSVAAAQGYADGEAIPLDLVERLLVRIVASTELPVSVDFEGGYAEGSQHVAENVARMLAVGVVGINFEDGRTQGKELYEISEQCTRIRAIRGRADAEGISLFINARTDLFLQSSPERHVECMTEATERAAAYVDAGANGIFIPGMKDESLIKRFCETSAVPINIMAMGDTPSITRLAELGVSRISFGPMPYLSMMQMLREEAKKALHELAP